MKQQSLPLLPTGFNYRLDLARAATPRDLKEIPRHRWFYFPHSYSPRLVHEVLDHWNLPPGSLVLDPFVGAGTTLLVVRERGMNAIGFDLSPLAVLVSRVKVRDYNPVTIQDGLQEVLSRAADDWGTPGWNSERLRKALTNGELSKFWALAQAIQSQPAEVQDFFMVALLGIARLFSRAVADGGWFRWTEAPDSTDRVISAFGSQAARMLQDLTPISLRGEPTAVNARRGDARELSLDSEMVDAIITSPPYPNRHDYTRVFHIELLLLGLGEQEIIELRHMPVRSHVEARPIRSLTSRLDGYEMPESLLAALHALPSAADKRIQPMLEGYFEDLYLALLEVSRVLKLGGHVAFVVGNARHAGVMVSVDEILGDIGQLAGLSHDATWVVRMRGNSAQQMGRFGREPSRESVVLLRKDG